MYKETIKKRFQARNFTIPNSRFTIHNFFLLLFLFPSLTPLPQQPIFEPDLIPAVTLEIWPDYDRPAALVLVTAALPADTPTPVRIPLPLPADATLNAVAYSENGDLVSLATYEREGNVVWITSPTPGVRLEYYLPLGVDGVDRVFTIAWTAPVDVGRLAIGVLEPAYSVNFALDQPIEELIITTDGLRTNQLPPRSVRAGETVVISGGYELPGDRLTAPPAADSAVGDGSFTMLDNLQANWPWTAAGIALLAVAFFFGWQAWQERRQSRPAKPARQRAITCTDCGASNKKGSNFCRECGKKLKVER